MKILFAEGAWADYLYWQTADRKTLKRVNQLIADIQRNENEGIGKPEPLRHDYSGYWSRRIDREHRLVYKVENETVVVIACRHHYSR